MGIEYRILHDDRVIVFAHVGEVSDVEMVETYRRLYADPNFPFDYLKIVDLRRSASRQRDAGCFRTLAGIVRKAYRGRPERSIVAILAPEDIVFGLSRMYGGVTDESVERVQVFREIGPATEWLGVRPDILED